MGDNSGLSFKMSPKEKEIIAKSYLGTEKQSESTAQLAKIAANDVIHVSITKFGKRVKLYFNEKKVYDLSEGLPDNAKYSLRFGTFIQDEGDAETTKMYISNLRYAIGLQNTRNKLLTEGKLVTGGILFESGSATIKGESYGVLKEIAAVLSENPNLKVKIVGHTDSDGDDAKNLETISAASASSKE